MDVDNEHDEGDEGDPGDNAGEHDYCRGGVVHPRKG